MISIRPYQPTDYEPVKQILVSSDMFDITWDSEINLASMQQLNPQAIQVAEVGGKVVGLVIIDQHGQETSFFYRLAVDQNHRGSGVGSALLQKAEEIARNLGAKEVVVYVDSENTIVQRFYIMKGYQASGKKFICMYKSIHSAH